MYMVLMGETYICLMLFIILMHLLLYTAGVILLVYLVVIVLVYATSIFLDY